MTERTFTFTVSNLTALDSFAAGVTQGTLSEFPSPSNAVLNNGSYIWDPTAAAVEYRDTVQPTFNLVQLLDWGHMMDYDPVTRRYFASGGRPSLSGNPGSHLVLKLVIYDEIANQWSAVDQWNPESYSGHLYRSTTVLTQHQLAAYHPHNSPPSTSNKIYLWDIVAQSYWGSIPEAPSNLGGHTSSYSGNMFLCWFPTMGSQGSLIYADSTWWRVAKFDWANRAAGVSNWVSVPPGNFNAMPFATGQQHINGHYHPLVDKMLLGNSGGISGTNQTKLIIVSQNGTMALTELVPAMAFGVGGGDTGGPFLPHHTLPLSIYFHRATNRIWTYDWRLEGTGAQPWQDRMDLPTQIRGANQIGMPHPSGGGYLFPEYGSNGTTKTWYFKPPSSWT